MQFAAETIDDIRMKCAQRPSRLARLGFGTIAQPAPPKYLKIDIKDESDGDTRIEVTAVNGQIVIITPEAIQEAEQIFVRANPIRFNVEKIQRAVCEHFGVSIVDLVSSRRTQPIVRYRQIAMYLAKKLTTRSLPEIGRRFRGRDHTTILHAVRQIEKLMKADDFIRDAVETITRKINTENA